MCRAQPASQRGGNLVYDLVLDLMRRAGNAVLRNGVEFGAHLKRSNTASSEMKRKEKKMCMEKFLITCCIFDVLAILLVLYLTAAGTLGDLGSFQNFTIILVQ